MYKSTKKQGYNITTGLCRMCTIQSVQKLFLFTCAPVSVLMLPISLLVFPDAIVYGSYLNKWCTNTTHQVCVKENGVKMNIHRDWLLKHKKIIRS